MSVSAVDSGSKVHCIGGLTGPGTGSGTFQPAANTSVNIVTDSTVPASANILFAPANGPAGLLSRSSTLFISTGNSAGSFTFNSSATAGTPPAGTETFFYFFTVENP